MQMLVNFVVKFMVESVATVFTWRKVFCTMALRAVGKRGSAYTPLLLRNIG